jgi:hypothetical protein
MPISVRKKNILLLMIVTAGLFGLAACETGDPGCYEPQVVSAGIGYQMRDTQLVDDTVQLDPLIVVQDTLDIFGDSIMGSPEMELLNESIQLRVRGDRNTKELGIAFNQAKDSIRYRFRTDTTSTVYDTLTIHYSSTLHFISNNCGYNYYFGIKNVTHTTHMLDSAAILNNEVTDATTRNVVFYFKRNF